MLAPRESFYPLDASVVITIDIEDCPVAEFPLTELYDITTSTIAYNYLEVLQEYVTQILEDTTWLDMQSKLCLIRARFCVYQRKNDGILYTLRKPALQRLINQKLRCHNGIHCPIEVPLFIRLRDSEINVPRKTRFSMALSLASNVHSGLCCSPSPPNRSFVADNEMLSLIIPDGVVAKGLNESANASAVDEEIPAVGHIGHAVVKQDTNDHEPHNAISITLDFDAMSTGDNDVVYGFGLDNKGFNNRDQNIDDQGHDDLADVCVVVNYGMDKNTATRTIVTDVCGPSPIMSAMVHRKASTHVLHHTEDMEMSPKGATAHTQYQIALAAVQFLLHHETFTIAHQHGVPLSSELMRYHPIDRGRCICVSLYHCQPLECVLNVCIRSAPNTACLVS
jgi:hypothetical protein